MWLGSKEMLCAGEGEGLTYRFCKEQPCVGSVCIDEQKVHRTM